MSTPSTMKAVCVFEPNRVGVVEIPVPPLREYEARVKVLACGFCNGTDTKIIQNELADYTVKYPCILGHESVGEVIEVGPDVKHIRVGDRFTNPMCRVDPNCGYFSTFGNMMQYGAVQDHKAMKEAGVDAARFVGHGTKPIPREIDPIGATVILTLKETYSALKNFGFAIGMKVLVYGDGPVGLGLCQFLRLGGASWVGCVGHHADRLEKVGRIAGPDCLINSHNEDVAAKIGDRKLDLVVDAVGATAIITRSSRFLKPGGMIGGYGVLKKSDRMIDFSALANNVRLHTLNWPVGEHAVHQDIVDMVTSGKLDLKNYYSHALPIDQVAEGVKLLASREAFKVVLTM